MRAQGAANVRPRPQVFVELGFCVNKKLRHYQTDLESCFLTDTVAFYRRAAQRWLAEDSCATYFEKCELALEEEAARVDQYLHQHTMRPLMAQLHACLLSEHQGVLLSKPTGLLSLLQNDCFDGERRCPACASREETE